MNKKLQTSIVVVLAGLLLVGLTGCGKKESEPAAPEPNTAKTPESVSATAAVTQTTCPIMGAPIDKNVFTEYQGQKVYFCCAGCVDKFKADPEKYAKDLPQLKK